ncbi:MAG: hypothetical protein ITG01_12350 [Comamonas sp.]|nr:hypothetical protein [Comamonas sp.]
MLHCKKICGRKVLHLLDRLSRRFPLAEPDLLRLMHRTLITDTVRALILDELRRLHEGVLARYGLLPSQLQAWKAALDT